MRFFFGFGNYLLVAISKFRGPNKTLATKLYSPAKFPLFATDSDRFPIIIESEFLIKLPLALLMVARSWHTISIHTKNLARFENHLKRHSQQC